MTEKSSSSGAPWLTLIGLGEEGPGGLGEEARAAIVAAAVVFGGKRHLALADRLIAGEKRPWLSPFSDSVEAVAACRGQSVAVLASGDPFFFGVGGTLAQRIAAVEMRVLPAASSFALAAARLGWPQQDLALLSLHGRPLDLIRPHLQPGQRLLALTSGAEDPPALARLLSETGFGPSDVTLLEALGGARERIRSARAADFALEEIQPLNLCAVEVRAEPGARVLPRAAGLDDNLFEHDGQITKREVRALTLSSLAPRRGELLWDIGAGAGSVAIEWMLADPAMRAVAVESDPERAQRIGRNAALCGVPGLVVVEGRAPAALKGLPQPDAIFVGGGGSEPGVMAAALEALPPGGRLVANAVTTAMEAVLLDHHARLGGDLLRLEVARAGPVGRMTAWRPAMPVTQWCWTRR